MKGQALISPHILPELIEQNTQSGLMTWRSRKLEHCKSASSQKTWNSKFAGKEAFRTVAKNGYLQGYIWNKPYYAHRVSWAMHFGEWPTADVDHIDGNRKNNAIANLRLATRSQNCFNRLANAKSTSKYCGVSLIAKSGKWRAQISANGNKTIIGAFVSELDAAKAYDIHAAELHGSFARLNFPTCQSEAGNV